MSHTPHRIYDYKNAYILKDTAKIVLSLLRKGNIIFHTL